MHDLPFRAAAWSLAALAILGVMAGCSAPTAEVTGVRLTDIDLQSVTIVFDLEVNNPNSAPLPLGSLDYEVTSRGNAFFTGECELEGNLPARGTKTISLPTKITYSQLTLALSNVKLGSILPYEANIGVSFEAPIVGAIRLPARHKGELPVPAPPAVKLTGVQWDSLTLDHAGGTFRLRLTNRNEFPMDIETLGFALTLGKMEVARSSLARPLSLDAGAAGELAIPISFSPKRFGLAALRMLAGDSNYDLAGDIAVGTRFGPMRIPFAKSGKVRLSK